jgi:hypothetical protein
MSLGGNMPEHAGTHLLRQPPCHRGHPLKGCGGGTEKQPRGSASRLDSLVLPRARLPRWFDECLGACVHHCRKDVQRHPQRPGRDLRVAQEACGEGSRLSSETDGPDEISHKRENRWRLPRKQERTNRMVRDFSGQVPVAPHLTVVTQPATLLVAESAWVDAPAAWVAPKLIRALGSAKVLALSNGGL